MIFRNRDRQQLAKTSTLQRVNDAHCQNVVTIIANIGIKNQGHGGRGIVLSHSQRLQQPGNKREQEQVCFHSRSDEANSRIEQSEYWRQINNSI